jgi:hypothetical protein
MTDRLEAFTVRKDDNNSKGFWTRVGVAFANKSGGWNVKLDALPVNGELVLMPPRPKDEQNSRQERPSQSSGGPAFSPGGMDDDIPFGPEFR